MTEDSDSDDDEEHDESVLADKSTRLWTADLEEEADAFDAFNDDRDDSIYST